MSPSRSAPASCAPASVPCSGARTETADEIHRFGACELDLVRFWVRRHGLKQETTPTELKLLAAFVHNKGRVLTRDNSGGRLGLGRLCDRSRGGQPHRGVRKKIEATFGAALPHQYPRRGISVRRVKGNVSGNRDRFHMQI